MTGQSLLTIGYARPGYGFGRVLGELQRAFDGRFRIEHLDLAEILPPEGPLGVPRRVDPAHVWRKAAQVVPDCVLLFADLDFVVACARQRPKAGPRLVAYVPIDSPVEASPGLAALASIDAVAVYTDFARESLLQALAATRSPAPPIHIVPHGHDKACFFPLDADPARARALAREALFGPDHGMERRFLVLNANRNQPRKRIDLTLLAFRRFLDIVPEADAGLYLHMGLRDRGIRILPLAGDLGIERRLVMPDFALDHPSVTDTRLNLVYNACDVGLNTADAEGWGLVSFEHGATGSAQLVPDHTGCGELWREGAILLPAAPYRDIALGRDAFAVDVAAAAEALAALYRSPALREHWGAQAKDNAGRKAPSWAEVGNRLAVLLGQAVIDGAADP